VTSPGVNVPAESPLASLFASSPSVEKEIVDELFSNENLDRKTELNKPITWSVMNTLWAFLDEHELRYSSGILRNFLDTSFRFLISHKRRGREEYVRALQAIAREHPADTQGPGGGRVL
jgi:hypothetical protein